MTPLLFQHPEWGAALAMIVCAIALALGIAILRSRDRTERLLGDRDALPLRLLASDALPFVALVLIGIALLGPRLGERDVRISTAGIDVVMLIDVSQSMEAADTPPSRSARARRAVELLLDALEPGDRAALAAFAGRGALLTPLTPDRDALSRMLPALDARLVRPGGTNLDAGIAAALEAIEPDSRRPAVIALLSDGEITATGGSNAGLMKAMHSGVRVIALAIGSTQGSEVPDQGAPLRDGNGAIVISRRSDASLERVARETGGAFAAASEWGEFDIAAVRAEIRRELAGAEGESVVRREAVATTWPFALAAALLLLIDSVRLRSLASSLSARTYGSIVRRRPRRVALHALICALPLFLVGADHTRSTRDTHDAHSAGPADPLVEGEDDEADDEARAALLRGLAQAELGDWPAAWQGFREAAALAEDPELAALAWYDLGVLYLEIGPLIKARDAFYEALALRPEDHEARFNLAWTLHEIERESDAGTPDPLETESKAPPASPPHRDQGDRAKGQLEQGASSEERRDLSEAAGCEAANRAAGDPAPGSGQRTRLEPLAEHELQRWLDRVEDDAGRGARALARDTERRRPARGPSW